jgi:hypothetical protein
VQPLERPQRWYGRCSPALNNEVYAVTVMTTNGEFHVKQEPFDMGKYLDELWEKRRNTPGLKPLFGSAERQREVMDFIAKTHDGDEDEPVHPPV